MKQSITVSGVCCCHCLGNTALTYACCGGYGEAVKVLLDAGALVEEPNENGHTPLMEAASGGHIGEGAGQGMQEAFLVCIWFVLRVIEQGLRFHCTHGMGV